MQKTPKIFHVYPPLEDSKTSTMCKMQEITLWMGTWLHCAHHVEDTEYVEHGQFERKLEKRNVLLEK